MGRPPLLLRLRCSTTFIAITVGLGVLTDLAAYGLIVPVIPFRLQSLGYDNIGSKVGWLVAAYAAGLIVSSPPIGWIGGKVRGRRMPLIIALLFMAGALVLFMETSSFTALLISRILQGFSGTGIWSLGLALVTDSVPEDRVGRVMGFVMIGFSVGSLIGAPVGGILYERLGYRAPFVFALCLVAVDLILRLLVVEKHVALKWIAAGVEIPGFEAPGYIPPLGTGAPPPEIEVLDLQQTVPSDPTQTNLSPSPSPSIQDVKSSGTTSPAPTTTPAPPTRWGPLIFLVTSGRPVTLFCLTILNGFILGGMLDTGMTLLLQYQYGLNSLGAGLVFIGVVAPSFFASPLAGWGSDKYGAKWITVTGIILSIPSYALLIIAGPLPLFIFFLVLIGVAQSLFITPVMQDLSVCVSKTPGLGSAWVYACFNMCFSIGAFVGPIVAGQLINSLGVKQGWVVQTALSSGFASMLVFPVIWYVGGPLKRGVVKEVDLELEEGKESTLGLGESQKE